MADKDKQAIANQLAYEENLARIYELVGQIRSIRIQVDTANTKLYEKIEKIAMDLKQLNEEINK